MTPPPIQTVDYIKADRIRLIQRSRRCLLLGWLGLVPFLGTIPACLAIRMHEAISYATGEIWKPAWLYMTWAVTLLVAFPAGWFLGGGGVGLVMLINIVFQGVRFVKGYQSASPLAWNPARHHAWYGMILAYTGLGLGILLMEMAMLSTLVALYKK